VSPSLASVAVSVAVFAGALVGLYLHRLLPDGHLTKDTQDVVRLGTGMLSVLSSLAGCGNSCDLRVSERFFGS